MNAQDQTLLTVFLAVYLIFLPLIAALALGYYRSTPEWRIREDWPKWKAPLLIAAVLLWPISFIIAVLVFFYRMGEQL